MKIVDDLKPLIIFAESSVLDVWPSSEYTSENDGLHVIYCRECLYLLDYVEITTIPSGATNIKVYEEGYSPSNYLGIIYFSFKIKSSRLFFKKIFTKSFKINHVCIFSVGIYLF